MSHAACRQELIEWVTANGRLPNITKIDSRALENLLGHKLYRLRKTYRDGAAKLHHLELLLSIPACIEGQDRAAAETRAADLRAQEEAKLREIIAQQSKVPFETARWDASFTQLQDWVSVTGSPPRRRMGDAKEYKIANWLNIQRSHARDNTLSPEREAKLRTVPGALGTRLNRPARERMADVRDFLSRHGRMPSPMARDRAEASLGNFVDATRERLRNGYLSAALAEEAAKSPGFLPSRGARFNRTAGQSLQALQDYVARHGHLPWGRDNRPLLVWCRKAGSGRVGGAESGMFQGAVQEIRAGSPDHNSWLMLTRFEEYVATHGHLPPARTMGQRFSLMTLQALLNAPSTPEPFKDRIRSILASTTYQHRASVCRFGNACARELGRRPCETA